MDERGLFPAELARTKPLGYSVFQLTTALLLGQVLAMLDLPVWESRNAKGQTIETACDRLMSYYTHRTWNFERDISGHDEWWQKLVWLRIAAQAFSRGDMAGLFANLPQRPVTSEMARNSPAWIMSPWEVRV
jgi:hypothetical protein